MNEPAVSSWRCWATNHAMMAWQLSRHSRVLVLFFHWTIKIGNFTIVSTNMCQKFSLLPRLRSKHWPCSWRKTRTSAGTKSEGILFWLVSLVKKASCTSLCCVEHPCCLSERRKCGKESETEGRGRVEERKRTTKKTVSALFPKRHCNTVRCCKTLVFPLPSFCNYDNQTLCINRSRLLSFSG